MGHSRAIALTLIWFAAGFVAGGNGQEPSPALLAASTHPIKYYLALPAGYQHGSAKRWPVLVCIEGAGSHFKESVQEFRRQCGELPLLVVTPCTFSNTNAIAGEVRNRYLDLYAEATIDGISDRRDWDEAGLLAILRDLRERYGAEERVYMTGFSGGGLLTYRMIGRHPELVAAAALVCANYFDDRVLTAASAATATARAFPIYQIMGEDDPLRYPVSRMPLSPLQTAAVLVAWGVGLAYVVGKRTKRSWPTIATFALVIALGAWFCQSWMYPGLESQNDRGARRLRELGYTNLRQIILPGMGHRAAPEHVLAAFRPLIAGPNGR